VERALPNSRDISKGFGLFYAKKAQTICIEEAKPGVGSPHIKNQKIKYIDYIKRK